MKRRNFLTTLGASAGLLSVGGCVTLRATGSGPGWKGPVTDHFDGKRFFNPRGPTGNTLGNLIRWQSSREQGAWPEPLELVAADVPGRFGFVGSPAAAVHQRP